MSNNSPENRKARRVYREYYLSQPADIQAQLPEPEREDDITGMDGNWVFPVNESHAWSESGGGRFYEYHEERSSSQRQAQANQGTGEPTGEPSYQPQDTQPSSRTYTEDEVQEVVRRVVMAMQLSESAEVLFQARCILIAFGIGDPPKESELARLKGCSRQFVSKKVKRIQQLFNLSPSQFMRSEHACRAYAKAYQRHKRYSRSPLTPPPPSGSKESIIKGDGAAG